MRFIRNWKTGIAWIAASAAGTGIGAVIAGIQLGRDERTITLYAAVSVGTVVVAGLAIGAAALRKS